MQMIEQRDEVAAYLKAGRRTVYRLSASGQLPAFKLGGIWHFHRGELDRWTASRIARPPMMVTMEAKNDW